ncbi:2-succinyl-6-hydroxy-2,4-cyclohexadiene-1-carboxylate synthase [Bacillus sp. EB600]|uniref:2-succinyl-6-hydroxy-2, 4-cyclohexadiene-1-carboxylate synthase n=1 Tax=Bacillus sp. EB600 TaxID=2806345 RepID=UPI00210A4051|nr:2-succinyl-6-hydroxy-2,4-cyclohexadiene-1-carboxylate synthase [Bacillus sp. EB600]MCQ6278476.1 2-succinyl-6-hydroxy-2,4-cyclohexadiene-1-carboxylate synthase [Bacillus sp. EB600]
MEIDIDEVSYHVETCGEGFPLLLLHGFTGDSSTWTGFCKDWGKHSSLIIPDIIGHGSTEAPEQLIRYKIEAAAKDLNDILTKLGVEKVDLLGYSMGGRLALTFAILFPDKLRKLILESSSPGLLTEAEREERCMKDGELAHFIKEKGIEPFVDYWEKVPLFSTMENQPQQIKNAIRRQRLSQSPPGLANSLLGMGTGAQPSWWAKLPQLKNEVLLLTGEKDEKFCRIAEKMQKGLKNSTWMVIENSGHAIHVEELEKFGTIVSEFLLNT